MALSWYTQMSHWEDQTHITSLDNTCAFTSNQYMGPVTKLRLSCYLVLLSIDSKTRQQDNHSCVTGPIYPYWLFLLWENYQSYQIGHGCLVHKPTCFFVSITQDIKHRDLTTLGDLKKYLWHISSDTYSEIKFSIATPELGNIFIQPTTKYI